MSERRHDLGLTQTDVVDRLAVLGAVATNRTLSAMEHGQGVDVGRLPELAQALDCTVTYLLGLTDQPAQWAPDEPAAQPAPAPTSTRTPMPIARPEDGPDIAHVSWILGPDIPERRKSASPEQRRA